MVNIKQKKVKLLNISLDLKKPSKYDAEKKLTYKSNIFYKVSCNFFFQILMNIHVCPSTKFNHLINFQAYSFYINFFTLKNNVLSSTQIRESILLFIALNI